MPLSFAGAPVTIADRHWAIHHLITKHGHELAEGAGAHGATTRHNPR